MADPLSAEVFAELVRRGLIAPTPPPEPIPGGNADRRAESFHSSWKACTPDGRTVKLTLGAGQTERARRHAAFARACPSLLPRPVFALALPRGEVAAEEFFAGLSLEQAAQTGALSPAEIQAAHARVCSALAATEEISTEEARQTEWRDWSAQIAGLSGWTKSERHLLTGQILPRLHAQLTTRPAATRWTNGDFLSANLLVAPNGDTRLVDLEFAQRTHFFEEDDVRFHVLSPIARRHPEWFAPTRPLPGPAWHLFFWLRQLELEEANNTPEYLARILPVRLALLRRLAEQTLDVALPGWSVESTLVHAQVEESRWVALPASAIKFSGWCHVPGASALRAICLFADDRLVAETSPQDRPDVQQHFAGERRALAAGFALTVPLADLPTRLQLCAQTDDGTLLPFHSVAPASLPGRGPVLGDYPAWAARHDPDPAPPAALPDGPLFSILLPVHNTPPEFLRACLASVRAQHYLRWELCVVDDASSTEPIAPLLREAAQADARIRLQSRATNGGIANATNDALALARGEFMVLLDHDDLLRPHALLEFARRLNAEPTLDALYSDEDKINAEGQRTFPCFKPNFSPEFLLGVMYVGHALCVRTTLARQAGGFDPAFDGVQDYEFLLRITERTRRIGHLSLPLYHWRLSPSSSALQGNVKGDMDEKQAAAVRAHLQRIGRDETVVPLSNHRVRLIPQAAPSFELIRLSRGESPLEVLQRALSASAKEVLVILATEPPASDARWAQTLAAWAARPDSGCVAPLFLSENHRVLESGCTVCGNRLVPMMRGFDPAGDGYNGSLPCTREVAAISPWCFAVRRQIALHHSTVSWMDFLRSMTRAGLYHRVVPAVSMQLPALSPPFSFGPMQCLDDRDDPFYNRHFEPGTGDYRLRSTPPPTPAA